MFTYGFRKKKHLIIRCGLGVMHFTRYGEYVTKKFHENRPVPVRESDSGHYPAWFSTKSYGSRGTGNRTRFGFLTGSAKPIQSSYYFSKKRTMKRDSGLQIFIHAENQVTIFPSLCKRIFMPNRDFPLSSCRSRQPDKQIFLLLGEIHEKLQYPRQIPTEFLV